MVEAPSTGIAWSLKYTCWDEAGAFDAPPVGTLMDRSLDIHVVLLGRENGQDRHLTAGWSRHETVSFFVSSVVIVSQATYSIPHCSQRSRFSSQQPFSDVCSAS